MRRLLLAVLVLASLGIAVGSAGELGVNGGVLQVFHFEVDIEAPPSCETVEETQATEASATSDSSPADESDLTSSSTRDDCQEGEPSNTQEDD